MIAGGGTLGAALGHRVPHRLEGLVDAGIGRDLADQLGDERAARAGAVADHAAGRRRRERDHARRRRDRGQPLGEAAEAPLERIAPRRVEDQHADPGLALGQGVHQPVDGDAVAGHVGLAPDARIQRDQVVPAPDLDAVAREEHQGDAVGLDRADEPVDGGLQRVPAGIVGGGHGEPPAPQRLGHGTRVAHRGRQDRVAVRVGGLGDDQGGASLGGRRAGDRQGGRGRAGRQHDRAQPPRKPRRGPARHAHAACPPVAPRRAGPAPARGRGAGRAGQKVGRPR